MNHKLHNIFRGFDTQEGSHNTKCILHEFCLLIGKTIIRGTELTLNGCFGTENIDTITGLSTFTIFRYPIMPLLTIIISQYRTGVGKYGPFGNFSRLPSFKAQWRR